MDKVRITWERTRYGRKKPYECWVTCSDQPSHTDICLFTLTNRAEFFRRYNAIVIEKEAPPDEQG